MCDSMCDSFIQLQNLIILKELKEENLIIKPSIPSRRAVFNLL